MPRLFFIAAACALLCGCRSADTGSATLVGEQFALPEITNSDGSFKVRIFESIKGASVWTAKDSRVVVKYQNAYTNDYFGVATVRDAMTLEVEIEPLQVEATAGAETAETGGNDNGRQTESPPESDRASTEEK